METSYQILLHIENNHCSERFLEDDIFCKYLTLENEEESSLLHQFNRTSVPLIVSSFAGGKTSNFFSLIVPSKP